MAKELPYFKFEPSQWVFGRINKQSDQVKVAFIDLICKYWHNLCFMTLEDSILDFGKSNIDVLIETKIIKISENTIRVEFLDDQFNEISKETEKLSRAGKESARKRALKFEQSSTSVEQSSTLVHHPSTDKIRLDKIKLDKIKIEEINHLIVSEDFINYWNILVNEKKWKSKSNNALELSLMKLLKNSAEDATEMMKNTISGGWAGIFELDKTKQNGRTEKIKQPAFKPGGAGKL